jgi:hypothetical protein
MQVSFPCLWPLVDDGLLLGTGDTRVEAGDDVTSFVSTMRTPLGDFSLFLCLKDGECFRTSCFLLAGGVFVDACAGADLDGFRVSFFFRKFAIFPAVTGDFGLAVGALCFSGIMEGETIFCDAMDMDLLSTFLSWDRPMFPVGGVMAALFSCSR